MEYTTMSASRAHDITHHLGGDWHGTYGSVPGPGHGRTNRNMTVHPHRSDPDDVFVHSFAGDDPLAIKDEWRSQGLLPQWSGRSRPLPPRKPAQEAAEAASEAEAIQAQLKKALWLWRRSEPIAGTVA